MAQKTAAKANPLGVGGLNLGALPKLGGTAVGLGLGATPKLGGAGGGFA